MNDPKDKKKKKKSKEKDTDFTDEQGGGEDDVFSKQDFLRVLDRAIDPPKKKKPDSKRGKTSE